MRPLITILALPVTAILLLTGRLVRRYRVDGESMLRAYAPGDRLLVESLTYRWRAPRVGDVVIVRQQGSDGRKDLKRIAAAPGSTVMVMGDEVVLAEDEWFVLGDNLGVSRDSRMTGPVKRRDILGRAWLKY